MTAPKLCEGERCALRQKAKQMIEEKKKLRPAITVNIHGREVDERGFEYLVGSSD